ncbi:type I glyceraldehyde-3-phosphate dehydrogenase [Paenibacillus flagellatus]|uniref:Type I glyceraldehyde-3-phosphate dehydrogenase n=1 Tax=Paenibacillus flagellatus TaxID=2211139 RepID=A0A2V5KTK7_9BACL|nr:type I glyceraldehyde-3-phosphate dehydrogenase [Paenibacillus flagellatus]PYI55097.1 type I glyceraldehyde-3-phosphate dehydrogenase [Paenibacillus flagellatus]
MSNANSVGIGINGLGRIGRLLIRRAFDKGDLDIRAVNATHPVESVAHLLRYDTVHGRWNADVRCDGGDLIINGKRVAVTAERDPAAIPWGRHGCAVVLDATGKFTDREGASKHLAAGAERVVVTAPGKNLDLTVVMGVNDGRFDPDLHRLVSAASCTTNCAAPLLHMIDGLFGVERGWITTVHAYTNDQNHMDNPHKDLRRARACTQSIVPTTTGVGKALAGVLPHLAPLVEGVSVRVPVPNVSLADMTIELRTPATTEEAANALRTASASPAFAPYVGWSDEPLVSSDYIGSDKSATIDGLSLASAGRQLKLLAWYDNEWGYACRVVDAAKMIAGPIGAAAVWTEAVPVNN